MSPWAGRPPAGAKVSLLVLLLSVVCSQTGRSERAPVSVSALAAGGCSGACLSRGVTAPWSRCHPTWDGAAAGQSPRPSSTVNLQQHNFRRASFWRLLASTPGNPENAQSRGFIKGTMRLRQLPCAGCPSFYLELSYIPCAKSQS